MIRERSKGGCKEPKGNTPKKSKGKLTEKNSPPSAEKIEQAGLCLFLRTKFSLSAEESAREEDCATCNGY